MVEVYLNVRPSISFYLMQILTNAVFSGSDTGATNGVRTDRSRGWDSLKLLTDADSTPSLSCTLRSLLINCSVATVSTQPAGVSADHLTCRLYLQQSKHP